MQSESKLLNAFCVLGYILVGFPIFYFTYKFVSPEISGQMDYYAYYIMYKDFTIQGVDAPTNMRLISSFIVHLFFKTGIYYPVPISFQNADYLPEVYFASVITSWISAVITCFLIQKLVYKYSNNTLLSILIGSAYLLQYGTIIWGSGGLADGFSTMFFCVLLYFWKIGKMRWFVLLLPLAIFQREIILMAFGITFFADLIYKLVMKKKTRISLLLLVYSILLFAVYVIFRETIFFTPKYSGYVSSSFYSNMFNNENLSLSKFFRGVILSQNIFIILSIILGYSIFKRIKVNYIEVTHVYTNFIGIIFVCFVLMVLPEAGRYFYISSPYLIYLLGVQIHHILIHYEQKNSTNTV